jgi:hypothetical protein
VQINKHRLGIWIAVILAVVIETGCGGGGGGGGESVNNFGQYTQGIWRGSVSLDGSNLGLIVGMIDSQGDANLIEFGGDSQLKGRIWSSGNSLVDSVLSDFYITGDLSDVYFLSSGTVSAGSSITATLMSGVGRELDISLQYDTLYGRSISAQVVAGHWSYSLSGYTLDWYIDSAGNLTGQDTNGCSYSGQASVSNPAHDMINMQYQISGCMYVSVSGLAILDDTLGPNDTLFSAATGDIGLLNSHSFVVRLARQ